MKYSPIAQPAYGAMYCKAAVSDAEATTMIVFDRAPSSSSFLTTEAIVEAFCPIAT